MLRSINQRFFIPKYDYTDLLDIRRARGLMYLLGLGLLFAAIFTYPTVVMTLLRGEGLTLANAINMAIPLVLLILYQAVNRGFYRGAAFAILILAFLAPLPILQSSIVTPTIVAIAIPLVVAGTLLNWQAVLLTALAQIALLAYFTFGIPLPADGARPTEAFSTYLQVLIVLSFLLIVFGTNIQLTAGQLIENFRTLRRVAPDFNLQSADTNEQAISAHVIDIIRDKLNYNYAQVFLVDESNAIQQRISGGLTKAQINVDTDIKLSEASGIYEALRDMEIVSLNNRSNETRRSHLLPGIGSALAIPIYYREAVIGVLDVQRENTANFSNSETDTLQMLAGQLGTAIGESRIINELRNNLSEQNKLIERQQERLLDFERAERRATALSWGKYLEQRGIDYLGFDFDVSATEELRLAMNLTDDLRHALEAGDVTLVQDGDMQIVNAPILLRGQTLGVMSFKVPVGRQAIGQRQTELIRSVVQRLALALENKRLFEQSQAQAQRETKANQVGNLLLSTTDIETVLKLAVENFNETIGAIQTRIRIQPETSQSSEVSL